MVRQIIIIPLHKHWGKSSNYLFQAEISFESVALWPHHVCFSADGFDCPPEYSDLPGVDMCILEVPDVNMSSFLS